MILIRSMTKLLLQLQAAHITCFGSGNMKHKTTFISRYYLPGAVITYIQRMDKKSKKIKVCGRVQSAELGKVLYRKITCTSFP
jgi:hypothetical protein